MFHTSLSSILCLVDNRDASQPAGANGSLHLDRVRVRGGIRVGQYADFPREVLRISQHSNLHGAAADQLALGIKSLHHGETLHQLRSETLITTFSRSVQL